MDNDTRNTYRVKKVWDSDWLRYFYYSQYRKPNGWFWRTAGTETNHTGVNGSRESAVLLCNIHALESQQSPKPKANRVTSYINLGKLP